MAVRALLFDIDDTLYDQAVPFGKAYRQAFPEIFRQGPSTEALFAARSRHSEYSFRLALNREMAIEEMYRYRIREAFAEFDIAITDSEADMFQKAYEQTQKELSLSPVMERLLADCKESGVRLGVISNGPGGRQRAKAECLGLYRYMEPEAVLISGDVGFVKPDRRIFRLAEERLGLRVEDTWYAGDSFTNDIAGAAQAGWHTMWMNRRRRPLPAGAAVRPDYAAAGDEELAEAVREALLRKNLQGGTKAADD